MPSRIVVEVNPSVVGGTEHFLAGMLGAIDRRRYQPTAVLHADGPTRWLFERHGIDTVVLNYAAEQEGSLFEVEVVEYLRSSGAALVQSSYFAPVLALAASHAGIPHVWRFGGHIDVVHQRNSEHQKKVFLSLATFLSRTIVCGSVFLRRQFDLIDHPNVEVIYNGLDLDRVGGTGAPSLEVAPTVAMVAHLVEQKRHEDFIRAAAIVSRRRPEVRFKIFGAPYPFEASQCYAMDMRRLAGDLGVNDRLEFDCVGDDRFDRLRSVSVFVLPSLNEGASNAILESLALGRPVIAADSGGHPELIDDGRTGYLVPPRDPEAIADRIAHLVAHPEVAARMSAAARHDAETRFDIRVCVRHYEALYDRALGVGQ